MDLFRLYLDDSFTLLISVSPIVLGVLLIGYLLIKLVRKRIGGEHYEINEAEIGIGKNKVKIKPNFDDMQIAYKLYLELTTRKIGLKVNFEDDFLVEIYNSWYEFFKVTREHIKDIPVRKIRRSKTTRVIVNVAIEVLNEGLRPHLTKWQARFRTWYDYQKDQEASLGMHPQDLQRTFPEFTELKSDLEKVNSRLIEYRNTMKKLAIGVN